MKYKLEEICYMQSGGTPRRGTQGYYDGNIPWATIADFGNAINGELLETAEYITPLGLKSINNRFFRKGTLLLAIYGSVGKTVISGIALATNQAILGINPKDENFLNIKYLKYWFDYNKQFLYSQAKGATLHNISLAIVQRQEIDLPDIQTQNKIVAILDRANALVQKREEAIQSLDKLLRAVFLEMFQPDLLDFKNSDVTLSQIASIVSGLTKGRKTNESLQETPYLRVANVQDGYFNLEDIKTIPATEREVQQYKIEKGDLLITEGGDSDKLGRGSVWEMEGSKFIYQNHLFRLRIKNLDEYSPYWLIQLINSEFGKYYFQRQAKQTTGIATINKRQVSNFPIPPSPFFRQKEFEKYYLRIKTNKKILSNSLADFKILLNSINQRAFNGQLNFNIDLELDALINEIDIQKSYNDLSGIERDNVYLQRLIDKLNDQEFKEKALYDKAKHGIFQLMAAPQKRVTQEYDEETQSLKLVLK